MKNTGPGESSLMATATRANRGTSTGMARMVRVRSNTRLASSWRGSWLTGSMVSSGMPCTWARLMRAICTLNTSAMKRSRTPSSSQAWTMGSASSSRERGMAMITSSNTLFFSTSCMLATVPITGTPRIFCPRQEGSGSMKPTTCTPQATCRCRACTSSCARFLVPTMSTRNRLRPLFTCSLK